MKPHWLVVRMITRCVLTAVIAGFLYLTLPLADRDVTGGWLRMLLALAAFFGAMAWQVRAILVSKHPKLRAVEALASVVITLVVLFAYAYLSMSASDSAAFNEVLDHPSSMYFTMTILSTVGFGDIVPVSDPARAVVSIQMLLDLIVIGLVVRVLMVAAQRGADRRAGESEADDGRPGVA